jgi:hypothetical protein
MSVWAIWARGEMLTNGFRILGLKRKLFRDMDALKEIGQVYIGCPSIRESHETFADE